MMLELLCREKDGSWRVDLPTLVTYGDATDAQSKVSSPYLGRIWKGVFHTAIRAAASSGLRPGTRAHFDGSSPRSLGWHRAYLGSFPRLDKALKQAISILTYCVPFTDMLTLRCFSARG